MNLQRDIAARSGEFLLFAVTPPRLTTSPQEAAGIARVTLERLRSLTIDGLVLYDIDDESDRNPDERPSSWRSPRASEPRRHQRRLAARGRHVER